MLNEILMWNKIGRIAMRTSERLKISPLRALDLFYTSNVCDDLHNSDTELYLFGDNYIVDELIIELENPQ